MGTFRHSKTDQIWIDGIHFPLAEFKIDEPGYSLPPGAIERNYRGGTEWLLTDAGFISGNNVALLESYISKLNVYVAARKARRLTTIGIGFARTLAQAKTKKKKQQKQIAVSFFRRFEDSDLELTDLQLTTYKNLLIAQKPRVAAEIDALTSIGAVAEYQYQNWPSPP